jgi:serine/threonine protein kinase
LRQLSGHESIVNLKFVVKQPFSLALQFVEGCDLASSLEDKLWQTYVPLVSRIRILRDIARGLVHMHEKGFVHRDIKPHNIVIHQAVSSRAENLELVHDSFPPFFAKITDFGTAVKICQLTEDDKQDFRWLDNIGDEAVGTSGYTAPEVLMHGNVYEFSSDIFSYGVLSWETTASTNRVNPLKGKEAPTAVTHIMNGIRPAFNQEQPVFLIKIIDSLWASSPIKRSDLRTVLRIYDELLSSPGNFLHLYNKKFFDSKQQTRRIRSTRDNLSAYYDIYERPNTDLESDADSVYFTAVQNESRKVEDEADALSNGPLREVFHPYPDRFEVIANAAEVVSLVRNRPLSPNISSLPSLVTRPSSSKQVLHTGHEAKESDKCAPLLITNTNRLSKCLSSMAQPDLITLLEAADDGSQSGNDVPFVNNAPLYYVDEAMHKYKVEHGLVDGTKHPKSVERKPKFSRKHSIAMESALLKESKNVFKLVDHDHREHVYVALVIVNVISAKNLINGDADTGGISDPYPVLTLGRQEEEGPVIMNSINPVWKTRFLIPWDGFSILKIDIFDKDFLSEEEPGTAY